MRHIKTIAALALLASLAATAADAQAWNNSGNYNGYGSSLNTPSNFSLRDQNGNLTMVDGQITSSNFSSNVGAQTSTSGVGTSGAGAAYGQAMAVGNQLNVTTVGSNNTVIVNSTQTNSGNQTAVVDLNNH